MPLVAFEGIDGTGKSTAIQSVAAELRRDGLDPVVTREETEGPTGEAVRRSVREGWEPLATALLFAADRVRHLAALRPHLEAGRLVLTDRFLHSSLAYQSVALEGVVPEPLAFLERLHEPWCPAPDRVVLLTMDPERAVGRAARRSATTPYEKAAFLARVQARYLELARRDAGRFTVVDADRGPDAVAADALAAVRTLL